MKSLLMKLYVILGYSINNEAIYDAFLLLSINTESLETIWNQT